MKDEKIKKLVFKLLDPEKNFLELLPDSPGNYIIALNHSATLPKVSISPVLNQYYYNGCYYDVIYTRISKKVLRREIINNILQEIIQVGLLCVNH